MSGFFGTYYLHDTEKNLFNRYEYIHIREHGIISLDIKEGHGIRDYEWKALSSNEIAVFLDGKDLGIRLIGMQGTNPDGYGRLMRKDGFGPSSQEYVRREYYGNQDWGGVYLLWDKPQAKEIPQFCLHEKYWEVRFYNKFFYESIYGPFDALDLPICWTRAFDDDDDYSEFRNNTGEYLYSFIRDGHFFSLYEGALFRGKYLRFSHMCLNPLMKGTFTPHEENAPLPCFQITDAESIWVEGLRSHRIIGQDDVIQYEPCELHVMGNKENEWILLYPELLDEYYMTFYTLRPSEEANKWTLFVHHEDGTAVEAGYYYFVPSGN